MQRFSSTCMCHCAAGYMVPDVVDECTAFIFQEFKVYREMYLI